MSGTLRGPLQAPINCTKNPCPRCRLVPLSATWCRVFGAGNALTRENSAPWKTYPIFEGTSEIQRLVVARAISGVHID